MLPTTTFLYQLPYPFQGLLPGLGSSWRLGRCFIDKLAVRQSSGGEVAEGRWEEAQSRPAKVRSIAPSVSSTLPLFQAFPVSKACLWGGVEVSSKGRLVVWASRHSAQGLRAPLLLVQEQKREDSTGRQRWSVLVTCELPLKWRKEQALWHSKYIFRLCSWFSTQSF